VHLPLSGVLEGRDPVEEGVWAGARTVGQQRAAADSRADRSVRSTLGRRERKTRFHSVEARVLWAGRNIEANVPAVGWGQRAWMGACRGAATTQGKVIQ